MLTKESRTYKLAKAALLAVLLAVTPMVETLRAQSKPLPVAANKEEDPMSVLFKQAEKLLEEKNYKQALPKYEELETMATNVEDKLKAVLVFRKASCLYFMRDWLRAEAEFTTFLSKFPNGTGDFFDSDSRRGLADLTLIEILAKQAKYDAALARLEKIRANVLARPEDRVNAFRISADIIVERSKSQPEDAKKQAYSQGITLLKQATAEGINTPERREAANKLVELYTKLGLTQEASQLKNEIDARSTGSPTEMVLSNFQRLQIGDARFASAEQAGDEVYRATYYRDALASYQGTLRRATLTRSFEKAIEAKTADIATFAKAFPKPNAEQAANLERVKADLVQFQKTQTEFTANVDYDAFISYRIGLCLLELKRPWEAYVAFQDIFDNSPTFSRLTGTYYYYIMALRQIGRNPEAQAKCKEFLSKYPEAEEVSAIGLFLGDISQEKEDFNDAITHFRWVKDNVKKLTPEVAEEIDFRIAACLFSQVDWAPAQKAFGEFLTKYPRSPVRQQVLYMNALCSFFQGKYKETKADFDTYQSEFPKGQFLPDVRYRQAIVKFGTNPPDIPETLRLCQEWLKDYEKDLADDVINQRPEVHTLIGDTYVRLAEEVDKRLKAAELEVRANAKSSDRAKYVAARNAIEAEKEALTAKSIDAYVAAAKSGRTNAQALEFVLGELRKLLPGRGEHKRMRDLFIEIYDWNHADPKAMTYLYEVIRSTERMGDKPEFLQQADQVQKDYSLKLAEARKKVEQLERADKIVRVDLDAAKAAVTKLSAELAADLAKVEKARQLSIQQSKDAALTRLSTAVTESITDRTQEGTEKLIVFLAEKIGRKVKRVKPGTPPVPGAYTTDDAAQELTKLLRLQDNRDSLVAQARGLFALGQLGIFTRDTERTNSSFSKIATIYKAEELSPTILAMVGDSLLARNEHKKAAEYFDYLLEHSRSSEFADYAFAGLAEIRYADKKYTEALSLCNEAIDNNILMSKELELRFTKARALVETGRFEDAKKEFEEIAKTKEWRGEKTAAALYWLGVIEERQANGDEKKLAAAVAYYRRCYMTWKKYEVWSAKAYLGAAKIFAQAPYGKPDDKTAAKLIIKEMLEKDRIKDTREASEAKVLNLSL